MAPQFMMTWWAVLDESRRECRNRGVQFSVLHTARPKTAAPCAISPFFTHRKSGRTNSTRLCHTSASPPSQMLVMQVVRDGEESFAVNEIVTTTV